MTDINVEFINPVTLKSERYGLERSIRWSVKSNNSGVVSLDLHNIEAAQNISLGSIIKIYKSNDLRFTGIITGRKINETNITLRGIDLNGILARRLLIREDPDANEASSEIKLVLNNFNLVGNINLDTDSFVQKTVTTAKWDWQYDYYDGWLKHIAERCLSTDGYSYGYRWFIDPNANLHFEPEGAGKTVDITNISDEAINNVQLTEDLDGTVNNLTYRGSDMKLYPSDRDAWTEQTIDGWEGPTAPTLNTVDKVKGLKSLHIYNALGGFWIDRALGTVYNYLDLSELSYFYFWYKSDGGNLVIKLIDVNDDTMNAVGYGLGIWEENIVYKGDFYLDSGSLSFDWSKVKMLRMYGDNKFTVGYNFYFDNLYFVVNEQVTVQSDADSIENYGKLEQVITSKRLKKPEIDTLALNYLNSNKHPRITASISLNGLWDISVNDNIIFKKLSKTYQLFVNSAQYYINQDGSETTQLYLGKERLEIDDMVKRLQQQTRQSLRNNIPD